MRTTSLSASAALVALATTALAACASTDGGSDRRDVDIDNGGVSPRAFDAGTDSGTGGGGSAQVHQFKSTSDIATASNGTWENQFYVRAGKGSDGKVHIDFSSSQVDPTSWTCFPPPWWDPSWGPAPMFCGFTRRTFTYAYGTLPNTSYRSGQGYAYLIATLANGPTMTVSSCTLDETTWVQTCAADPGGLVDLKWRATGFFSTTQTGSREENFGFFQIRTSGSFKAEGADVTGSILGANVAGAFGQIVRTTGAALQFTSSLSP